MGIYIITTVAPFHSSAISFVVAPCKVFYLQVTEDYHEPDYFKSCLHPPAAV